MKSGIETSVSDNPISYDSLIPEADIKALGINTVPMTKYKSFAKFVRDSINGKCNFSLYFRAPDDSVTGPNYRAQPVFERFGRLAPSGFVDDLRARADGRRFSDLDPHTQVDMYKAHESMCDLVDESDPYVLQENGEVDEDYLRK